MNEQKIETAHSCNTDGECFLKSDANCQRKMVIEGTSRMWYCGKEADRLSAFYKSLPRSADPSLLPPPLKPIPTHLREKQ